MPRISKADLDEIFADSIADVATVNGSAIRGHFFSPDADALDIHGAQISFTAERSAIAIVSRGNTMTINAVNYRVERIDEQRAGTVVFTLSKL